jgi:MFS family permease
MTDTLDAPRLAEGVPVSAAPRPSRLVLLAPLRQRSFRLLFAGQVVSNLGDWLDLLALLALIAYQWRLGAAALAGLTMMMLLPAALVSPLAGVFVDRWPCRRVMIVSDLARAGLALTLIWAPNVVVLLATVFTMRVFSTFFSPARQVAIRLVVPADDLLQANALSRLSINVTKVLGPGLGGAVVLLAGPRGAFVADSVSFLMSAALLGVLRLPRPTDQTPAGHAPKRAFLASFGRDFAGGVGYIFRTPLLAVAVGAQMAEALLIESNDSLIVLAFKGLGMSATVVGFAIGCSGLGNVAGALAIGQWGGRLNPLRQMGAGKLLLGLVGGGVGVALLLGIQGDVRWFPAVVASGVGFAAIWVPFSYIVQRETPPELLGRVSATAVALYTTTGLAGPPLGAFLAQRVGVGMVFVLTGGAITLLGLLLVVLRLPEG